MNKDEILEKYIETKLENQRLKDRLSAKKYKLVDNLYLRFSWLLIFVRKFRKSKKEIIRNNNSTSINEIKEFGLKKEKKRSNKIYLINYRFFDYEGKVVYKGGAERYMYDLSILLKNMGYKPIMFQLAKKPFTKKYRDLEVVGVRAPEYLNATSASKIYNRICKDADLVIASPMELASEIKQVPVISINHGVNFDSPFSNIYEILKNNYYLKAALRSFRVVCVDTNFINWSRTVDYISSKNMVYVPNYYEENDFSEKGRISKQNKLIFIYPRRIYSARGYDLTIEAFRPLLKKYKNKIELHFVGQLDNPQSEKDIENIIAEFPDQVKQYEIKPEEMSKVYKYADIAIIPTRYSEGTSLSCIEALASGCAVISTNIGGLPNIIIDKYNGLLVSPEINELRTAAEKLIIDKKLRERIAKNGVQVAKSSFTKKVWDDKWRDIINLALEDSK